MLFSTIVLILSQTASVAFAQQQVWDQCGGIGWTGGTTCVAGATCTKLNDWYFQCLPGSSNPPTMTTTTTSTTTTSTPTSGPTNPPGATPNFWFSFGDSYTATGFNAGGTLPSIGNPLGNPPYPGSPTTPGPNWIDLITVKYNKTLFLTYNYAFSGATIDQSLVAPFQSSIPSVKDQVGQFLDGAGKKPSTAQWDSNNAMFSVWIGINDIGTTYNQGGDRAAFNDRLLDAYFAQVERLVNVGARNFLFINVPCVERSPLMLGQSQSARDQEKAMINSYNSKLVQRIQSFQSTHSGVTTYQWDSYSGFTTILNSPTQYGFSDATSVGNSNSFWGDVYHPSSKAHEVFTQAIRDQIAASIW